MNSPNVSRPLVASALTLAVALSQAACALEQSPDDVDDVGDVTAAASVIPNANLEFPKPPTTIMYRKEWNDPVRWSIENICYTNHFANDDPIVFFDQPGMSHRHEFMGNVITKFDTTIDDLILSNQVSCLYKADQSAYWFPALMVNGAEIKADRALIYYKASTNPAQLKNIPTGLRMLAGSSTSLVAQPKSVGYWYEHGNQNGNNTAGSTTMVTAHSGTLGLELYFPECWDGEHLDSGDHRSHMAYATGAFGSRTCPASHPVALPQLSYNVLYKTQAGPKTTLASGKWTTFHGDYINAWNPQILQGAINACLKTKLNCRTDHTADLGQRQAITIPGGPVGPYMPQAD